MKQSTALAVRNILKEQKSWTGNIQDLCKKHGISAVSFYRFRKSETPAKPKSQYTKTPKFVDVPLHTNDAVYIVKCSISNVRRVLEEIK